MPHIKQLLQRHAAQKVMPILSGHLRPAEARLTVVKERGNKVSLPNLLQPQALVCPIRREGPIGVNFGEHVLDANTIPGHESVEAVLGVREVVPLQHLLHVTASREGRITKQHVATSLPCVYSLQHFNQLAHVQACRVVPVASPRPKQEDKPVAHNHSEVLQRMDTVVSVENLKVFVVRPLASQPSWPGCCLHMSVNDSDEVVEGNSGTHKGLRPLVEVRNPTLKLVDGDNKMLAKIIKHVVEGHGKVRARAPNLVHEIAQASRTRQSTEEDEEGCFGVHFRRSALAGVERIAHEHLQAFGKATWLQKFQPLHELPELSLAEPEFEFEGDVVHVSGTQVCGTLRNLCAHAGHRAHLHDHRSDLRKEVLKLLADASMLWIVAGPGP
mmetsp:Transcript_40774/g.83409  ORF Transcript_40774/g.83409 Transcript_40774/m.83409 type:complete len:385 (+) Transcript_40774:107-1261(+)